MSDFTPTTEYARNAYQHSVMVSGPEMREALGAEFDRWLAAHDREVAARALREAGTWLGDEGAIGIEDLLKWRADRIEKGEINV